MPAMDTSHLPKSGYMTAYFITTLPHLYHLLTVRAINDSYLCLACMHACTSFEIFVHVYKIFDELEKRAIMH
jgi:hypothetical protein